MPRESENLTAREVTTGTLTWNGYEEGQLDAGHLSTGSLPSL